MAKESGQHKLGQKPRVHITYKLETGNAIQNKELPFVVGVLADLSGNKPGVQPPKFRDREFTSIDRDNFDTVMAKVEPGVAFQVENTLQNDGSKFNVKLGFGSLEGFEPGQVAAQIAPLAELLQERARLSSLLDKLDGNDKLDDLLQQVLRSTESLKKLSEETGRSTPPTES